MIELPQPWPTNPWPTRFRTVRASPSDVGLRFVTVQSPALRGRGDVAIHVPEAAVAVSRPLPLVVLLHGVYGSFWNWTLSAAAHRTLDRMIANDMVQPMALVMPGDGLAGEGTGYVAHPDIDYEQWIMGDVIDLATEMIDGVTTESPLFIGGNSMGGFGAGHLVTRHSSRIRGAIMHSAIVHLDQLDGFTVEPIGDTAGLPEDQRDLGPRLCSASDLPPLYIDCGRNDFLFDANLALHRDLAEAGVAHEWHACDGGHDWGTWMAQIEQSLRFVDRVASN